jgi:hypothetical protein
VGFIDEKAEGWRLYKWNLSITLNPEDVGRTYAEESFVSALLLEMVENQAIRKFAMYDEGSDDRIPAMLVSHRRIALYHASD